MSPAELHHLNRVMYLVRDNTNPATAAIYASANEKGLIVGGSIGLFMILCVFTFVVQGPVLRHFRTKRQRKEMEGYSQELVQARKEKAAQGVDDGAEEGVDVDVKGKGKGRTEQGGV